MYGEQVSLENLCIVHKRVKVCPVLVMPTKPSLWSELGVCKSIISPQKPMLKAYM